MLQRQKVITTTTNEEIKIGTGDNGTFGILNGGAYEKVSTKVKCGKGSTKNNCILELTPSDTANAGKARPSTYQSGTTTIEYN